MNLGKDVDLAALAQHLDSYSGADITRLCREASMMPMRARLDKHPSASQLLRPKVRRVAFEIALQTVHESITAAEL